MSPQVLCNFRAQLWRNHNLHYLIFIFNSWLHHEATVCETETTEDDKLKLKVIMDEAALGKYNSKFGKID